jgi:hypothetical protein
MDQGFVNCQPREAAENGVQIQDTTAEGHFLSASQGDADVSQEGQSTPSVLVRRT